MDIVEILDELYDSEISFEISCLYDAGFWFVLGDEYNGKMSEQRFDHFKDGVMWLMEKTMEYYPDSDFSKTWTVRKAMSERLKTKEED